MSATAQALRRMTAGRHRHDAVRAGDDNGAWVVTHRERIGQLIELGNLIAKAGLIQRASDDRAMLLGAFMAIADQLAGEGRELAIELWGLRGRRAFGAEADGAKAS